jgi:hypothetical protein
MGPQIHVMMLVAQSDGREEMLFQILRSTAQLFSVCIQQVPFPGDQELVESWQHATGGN